jgi:hypothetical protein
MSPRHLAESYGLDADDRWDHIIGPEMARAHEAYRAQRPARHRGYDPAADYFETARTYAGGDTRLMRAIDQAQQTLGNDGPECENVSGPKPTAPNGRRGLTHNRRESNGGLT